MNDTTTTAQTFLQAALFAANEGHEATGCWASLTDLIRFTIDAAVPEATPEVRAALTEAIDALVEDTYGETYLCDAYPGLIEEPGTGELDD